MSVTNIDNPAWGWFFNNVMQDSVTVSVTITTSGPTGVTVTTGLFNEDNGLPLYLNPGQEFTRGATFVGPGTVTVGFVNQSPYVLSVGLYSTPHQCALSGC